MNLDTGLRADAERARVAAHVAAGERAARTPALANLDPLRALLRTLVLDELEDYHQRGVFPKNRDFPGERVPYFIDADGTRCAIAHLMEQCGAPSLVSRIAAERNHALVPEMADIPSVLAWLDAVGLSVEEAARIQPTYGCYRAARMVCEGLSRSTLYRTPVEYVLEVCVAPRGELDAGSVGTVLAPVSAVYGATTEFRVGDVIALPVSFAPAGTSLVVPRLYTHYGRFATFQLDAHGRAVFYDSITRADLTLTREQFLQALFSHDCVETLTAIDPRWRGERCDDGGGAAMPRRPMTPALCLVESSGGCGARVTPSAEGDAVVLAMIGALLLRRAARVGVVGDGAGR